ncbi:MAG: hypothetical protein GXZ11_05185 [Tissierellia bacterium]|nr:hypothetical protein [Tissierellia bacterium]
MASKKEGRYIKKITAIFGVFVLIIAVMLGGYLAFSAIIEWKPKTIEDAEVVAYDKFKDISLGKEYSMVAWNVGYGGLDASQDFFMDGGKTTMPAEKSMVEENVEGILSRIKEIGADFTCLQELDRNSKRSYFIDQKSEIEKEVNGNSAYADNFNVPYVPYPLSSPIGKVKSGVYTISKYKLENNKRIALPVPFKWPIRMFNLKRCLLVSEVPIEDSDKKLILVNLHLEAYDSGAGKVAQTNALAELLLKEYAKGHYVIACGDWNQAFEENIESMPYPEDPKLWRPGKFDLPEELASWTLGYDIKIPSNRLNNKAYVKDSPDTYISVVDGFIASPNIKVISVENMDFQFELSDHNPVIMRFELKNN